VTLDPVATTVISVLASIVTTVITIVVKESFDTQNKIGRMLLGLCIDSAGTVRAFESHTQGLNSGLKLMDAEAASLETDFKILRALPSGLIVSPPLGLPKELVHLLPAEHARTVFLYYDGWERFAELERRYRELFQTILTELAKAKFDPSEKSRYDFLREERFDQLRALVRDLHHTINKLAANCCEILGLAPTYLDHASTQSVEKLTGGRWNTWQQIRESCAKFHGACESACG
jgi:hypothetical protein